MIHKFIKPRFGSRDVKRGGSRGSISSFSRQFHRVSQYLIITYISYGPYQIVVVSGLPRLRVVEFLKIQSQIINGYTDTELQIFGRYSDLVQV